nr:tellurite resistance TerB family protein [Maritimibacter dapengensis]
MHCNTITKEPPVPDLPHSFTPEDSLIAVMMAVSLSDGRVETAELLRIEEIVNHLPVFATYDQDRIKGVSNSVFDLMSEEDGLDALFGLVRENLPEHLWETAYAMACDVAAADATLRDAELRILEEIRYELNIDRLHAAAIERGARARHMTL